jgi:two-component system nitrogen regulation response regulator NtrX
MPDRILIVDDEPNIRRTLEMVLRSEGFETIEAESAEAALRAVADASPDVAILDVQLPGMSGIDALRAMRRADPDLAVVMISGHATIAIAVEATREGAFDFLEKPLAKERVLVAVRNALRLRAIGREVRGYREREAGRRALVGESEAMRTVREEIARVAPAAARVLIRGESGTGKELVARAIHEASPRKDRPFVKVNCAAIPEELIESELFGSVKGAFTGAVATREGKFEQADGGTIFLDEVGDMSLRAQAKVLRAIQEGEVERVGGSGTIRVDVRVLSATNQDLEALAREGRFREDLYFRLNVVPIRVPPLRERKGDVRILARHFLDRCRIENDLPFRSISEPAMATLDRLPWRGNVRELANAIERLVIMAEGPVISIADLEKAGLLAHPPVESPLRAAGETVPALRTEEIARLGGLAEARRAFEIACIREGLRASGGNVSEAARLLGIDRTNLHKKIQVYGINMERNGTRPEEDGETTPFTERSS